MTTAQENPGPTAGMRLGGKIEDEAAGLKAFKSVQALTDFIAEHAKA